MRASTLHTLTWSDLGRKIAFPGDRSIAGNAVTKDANRRDGSLGNAPANRMTLLYLEKPWPLPATRPPTALTTAIGDNEIENIKSCRKSLVANCRRVALRTQGRDLRAYSMKESRLYHLNNRQRRKFSSEHNWLGARSHLSSTVP